MTFSRPRDASIYAVAAADLGLLTSNARPGRFGSRRMRVPCLAPPQRHQSRSTV
jgi:hypothetical protein